MATRKKATTPVEQPAPTATAGAVRPSFMLDAAATQEMTKRKTLYLTFEDGINYIRVLPRFDNHPSLFVKSVLHYQIKREEGDGTFAPGCLNYHGTGGCYICAFVAWMTRNAPSYRPDLIPRMEASDKMTAQVFSMDKGTKKWSGPYLAAISSTVSGKMGRWLSTSQDMGQPAFVDFDKGRIVAVSKTGREKGTRYDAEKLDTVVSLDEIMPDWPSKVIMDIEAKLDVKVLTVDEQKRALYRTCPDAPWDAIQKAIG